MTVQLPDIEKKSFEEMWSASSSGAIHALAGTLGRSVQLARQDIEYMPLNNVPALMNKEGSENLIIYLRLSGVAKGVVALSAQQSSILTLADMLLHKEIGTFKILDKQNFSVINELLNLMTGYYVDAIVARISGKINMSEPVYSVNPYKAIYDFGLGETFNEIKVLVFENKFMIPDVQVTGETFLILSEKTLKKFI